ncbi:hypothetical protein HNQ59_003236 [Chitinivorax tropicus]|uniref:KAP NTPase domain-containing protein n=1 Tax=Chitinivorax tropicus TaxID=714531 RepID=A0A840MMR0_9PROT|nr:P-loop NTPase fold protein [Chitinivorax tropicus]MBB5019928.1 hypothetical protein [Chitinivorax tropicus]
MSIPALNDEPTLDDKLDRKPLVKAIAEQIAHCTPPMVLGVHGDWGAGKTSMLKQIRRYLTGEHDTGKDQRNDTEKVAIYDEHIVTVWFEAWRYQHEPVPVVALLQAMRRALSTPDKMGAQIKKIGEIAFRGVLNQIHDAAKTIKLEGLVPNAEKIQALGVAWEKEHLAERLPPDLVRDMLSDALSKLLPKKSNKLPSPRLVVFIDDLDRCSPESAFRLLEGLKIYLSLPNCVFVLGMNQQVIAANLDKSLQHDTGVTDSARIRGEAYLEKLCTNIWRLPLPRNREQDLLAWVWDQQNRGSDKTNEILENLHIRLKKALGRDAKTQDQNANDQKKLGDIPFLPPNPRRLKALANLMRRMAVEYELANPRRDNSDKLLPRLDEDTALHLLVVAYVYQFHGGIYERWHYQPDLWSAVLQKWVTGQLGVAENQAMPEWLKPLKIFMSESVEVASRLPYMEAHPNPSSVEIFWIAPLLNRYDFLPSTFNAFLNIAP